MYGADYVKAKTLTNAAVAGLTSDELLHSVKDLLTKKPTKRLRGLRQTGYIAEEEQKKIRELIPYK